MCGTDVVAVVPHGAFKQILGFEPVLKHDELEIQTGRSQKWISCTILGLEMMCLYFFNARHVLTSSRSAATSASLAIVRTDNGRRSSMLHFGRTMGTRSCTRQCRKLHKATEWVLKKGFGIFKYRGHSRGRP